MRAAAAGVVYADHDLSWEQVLHTKVPLINLGVPRSCRVQAVVVRKTPQSESAVFWALGLRQAGGERIRKGCKLRLKVVLGEADGGRVAKGGAGELKIGRHVQAVIDSGTAADDRFGIDG